MVISNSSSSSMTSSTMSSESAPTSSIKEVERVTCSLLTPRFSQTISITRSSTEATFLSLPEGSKVHPRTVHPVKGEYRVRPRTYVPQRTHVRQAILATAQDYADHVNSSHGGKLN